MSFSLGEHLITGMANLLGFLPWVILAMSFIAPDSVPLGVIFFFTGCTILIIYCLWKKLVEMQNSAILFALFIPCAFGFASYLFPRTTSAILCVGILFLYVGKGFLTRIYLEKNRGEDFAVLAINSPLGQGVMMPIRMISAIVKFVGRKLFTGNA